MVNKYNELLKNMRNSDERRIDRTIKFIGRHITDDAILDLGVPNKLTARLKEFDVENTTGQDLDVNYNVVHQYDFIIALEIFEHMFAPFNILNEASGKLIASVPLKLWFASAYWPDEKLDRHYHEFEKKQFDALLERTGWTIKDSEMWTAWSYKIGFRSILRLFHKRHYIIYAEKD